MSPFVRILTSEKLFCGNGMLKNKGNRKRVLLECCSSSMGHWHGSLGAHDVLRKEKLETGVDLEQ